jgi:hypothetical protein
MAPAVEVLRAMRAMLADGGSVVMIDERVADEFAAPAPDLERYHYGWSVVSWLPGAMEDPADRRHRRRPAGRHAAAVCPGGGLPRRGGAADRDGDVAVLWPISVTGSNGGEPGNLGVHAADNPTSPRSPDRQRFVS